MWQKWALVAVIPVILTACGGSNYASKGRHHRSPPPKSDIPLVMNDRVAAWVDYFSGPGRDRFARYMQRSGRYEPMIRQIMKSYGLPQDLIYLAMIESGFSSKAKSHASAVGVWQFIRATGNRYGLDQDIWVEERQDAEKSTHAAAQYLRDLYNEFGDWYLAMAAYNSGEGTVRRGIARCGCKDFWEMSNPRTGIFRAETRDYVPKMLAAAIVAKSPEKYGLGNIRKDPPINFELAKVDTHVDIDVIAKCADTDVATIEILNSELKLGTAPPNYKVRIPPGMGKKFHASLARIDPRDRVQSVPSAESHTVGKKETLRSIAKRYGVNSRAILTANGLKSARSLKRGMVISIPGTSRSSLYAASSSTSLGNNKALPTVFYADLSEGKKYARRSSKTLQQIAREPDVSVVSVVTETPAPTVASGYVVTVGDSWNSISQNLGIATAELKKLNPEAASAGLYVGDVLKISDQPAQQTQVAENTSTPEVESGDVAVVSDVPVVSSSAVASAKKATATYRVKRGDSLGKIASQHGVSIENLRAWNGLKGGTIRAGQKLRVSGPASTRSEVGSQKVKGSSPKSGKVITYKVKPGDSLWTIGKQHNISATQMKQLSASRKGQLRPGEVLTLRTGS